MIVRASENHTPLISRRATAACKKLLFGIGTSVGLFGVDEDVFNGAQVGVDCCLQYSMVIP